ncbi:NAD(P)H-dependent FMN reductase [Naumannella cuiyingiana]|uniref:NAD(P)H-dependent FMN reductase n=1 Tax=Naumannella cuiyingiana TaxID=1347891 RepID=A0A7Z0D8U9_9ACTN|nr:NAD(P)H-dependent oxidoreductase [Naumannella cuiyingiana]NYI70914.1 NAD(P)H-dependent FMN reductase [Naumannella cuiyingiana]
MTEPVLQVIIASTRPGRVGRAFGEWFAEIAREHGGFRVELIDLAEVGLPFLDEPKHPRLGDYQHQHTRDWSATIARGDAYVFVTPEYNYGYNAVLKNAIDFLHNEWHDKAVGFVGYGGIGAGTRAIQQLKQVVTTLRMVPVFEAVNVPFAAKSLDAEGRVVPDPERTAAANAMLDELARVTAKLRPAS